MFNIHDLQYWAKALRQFCSPAFDRDSIIKSSAYKRELNLVPLGKTKGSDKIFSKELCQNEAWGKWKSVFLNILNKHGDKRIIRVRTKPAPWLNFEVRQQVVKRDYLKRKAVKTGLQND